MNKGNMPQISLPPYDLQTLKSILHRALNHETIKLNTHECTINIEGKLKYEDIDKIGSFFSDKDQIFEGTQYQTLGFFKKTKYAFPFLSIHLELSLNFVDHTPGCKIIIDIQSAAKLDDIKWLEEHASGKNVGFFI
jgi:hypothetical protein